MQLANRSRSAAVAKQLLGNRVRRRAETMVANLMTGGQSFSHEMAKSFAVSVHARSGHVTPVALNRAASQKSDLSSLL
eukprot:475261-Pyramimonas_sp.AAC.1